MNLVFIDQYSNMNIYDNDKILIIDTSEFHDVIFYLFLYQLLNVWDIES